MKLLLIIVPLALTAAFAGFYAYWANVYSPELRRMPPSVAKAREVEVIYFPGSERGQCLPMPHRFKITDRTTVEKMTRLVDEQGVRWIAKDSPLFHAPADPSREIFALSFVCERGVNIPAHLGPDYIIIGLFGRKVGRQTITQLESLAFAKKETPSQPSERTR